MIAAASLDAFADRKALIRRGVNGTRRLVARTALRRNIIGFVVAVEITAVVLWAEVVSRQWGVTLDDVRQVMHVRNYIVTAAVLKLAFSAAMDLVDSARLRRKVAAGVWEPPPGR